MPYSPYNWDKVGIDISKVQAGKAFCPKCGSTRKNKRDRSLFVNLQTGVYRCFYHACDFRGCVADKPQYTKKKDFTPPLPRLQKVSDKVVEWFEKRKISNNTLLRMNITESVEYIGDSKKNCICFNYFRDEKLANIKFRSGDKGFRMVAGAELIPYNIDAAKDTTELIWVEGECDCLAAIESNVFNVVSVPNGANGDTAKLEFIDNCWQEISHIEKHIIAVDDDEAGRKLKDALSYRFGIEKCWFVKYPKDELVVDKDGAIRSCKDMNEVLDHFGKEKVREIISLAEQPPLSGVYHVIDVAEEIFEIFSNNRSQGETTHYPELDKIFKWKRKDINLWFGYGNRGKTQVFVDKALVKTMYDGWKWAVFCPENYPATDFFIDLIEMYVGKHIDERMSNKMSSDELADAIDFLNEHFFYVFPEDVQDLDTIHILFRNLILRHGIDGVLIDPWNQLDQIVDERDDKYLSKALKEIKKFALLNNISYNIIAHPKGIMPNKDGEMPRLKWWHLAGGPMWNNKCDNIICVERPDWDKDSASGWTRLETQKIKRRRTGGSLGECDFDYLLRQSRYAERGTDKIICDPKRATMFKEMKQVEPPTPKLKQQSLSKNWYERDTDDADEIKNTFN